MTDSAVHEDGEDDALHALYAQAYAAFDAGNLAEAETLFGQLTEELPDVAHLHYMRALACKYLLRWDASLQHNLQAQVHEEAFDEASAWNAGIAATGLGDWAQARTQWQRCGIDVGDGEGPIERDFGVASVRLNPWSAGETVFVRRIDPVRGRLLNVPLPDSGHRFGDIVLHDGASTGQRWDGERDVPVFNALQTLHASDYRTFVAFIDCPDQAALDALRQASLPGIGYVEDWTGSVRHLCLRCSYGAPHREDDGRADNDDVDGWQPERNLGIAAQGRVAVQKLLADWVAGGPDRHVDGMEEAQHTPPSAPEDGQVWWISRDGNADEDGGHQDTDGVTPP